MKELVITKNEEGIRLNKYIKKHFATMPDSLMHKLFRKKYFEVNDKKANGTEFLCIGDKVTMYIGDDTYNKYKTTNKEITKVKTTVKKQYYTDIADKIIYEDGDVILFDKPVGMLSQGDKSGDISVNTILNDHVHINSDIFTPSIVNRLDRNTSGIIIFAKTNVAARAISSMIRDGNLEKRYKTRVNGVVKRDKDTLIHLFKKDTTKNTAIIRDYKDKIIDGYTLVKLSYKVIKRYADTTELDIDLVTGKSHQIRAQLSHIGHPIVCDKKYMDKELYDKNVSSFKTKSQILCCYKIRFGSFKEKALINLSNKTFEI